MKTAPFGTGNAYIAGMEERPRYDRISQIHNVFPIAEVTLDFSLACKLKLVFSARTLQVD
jgi:hypothetical protein